MKSSVSKSTLAVASSNIKILLFFNNARAKQINYFYPIEKTEELLAIFIINIIFINWKFNKYLSY
jgi:hypothetical protein